MDAIKELLAGMKDLPHADSKDAADAASFLCFIPPKDDPKPYPDTAFIQDLHGKLTRLYQTTDKIARYFEVKESAGLFPEHKLDIVDVRLEPSPDFMWVWYSIVRDNKFYRRVKQPLAWDKFLELSKNDHEFERTPFSLVKYGTGGRKMSGPIIRELSVSEAIALLQEQNGAFAPEKDSP